MKRSVISGLMSTKNLDFLLQRREGPGQVLGRGRCELDGEAALGAVACMHSQPRGKRGEEFIQYIMEAANYDVGAGWSRACH